MKTQFTYIQDHIHKVYQKKLIVPCGALIFLLMLTFIFPVYQLMHPFVMSDKDSLSHLLDQKKDYITLPSCTCYFTGYTNTRFGQTTGYYYYTLINHQCILLLLTPSTSEEGLPSVSGKTISGRLLAPDASYDALLDHLSEDLSWTKAGISSQIAPALVSEPSLHGPTSFLFLLLYWGFGIYSLISLFLDILFCLFPVLSPACQSLGRFGHPKKQLLLAEEELATLPQLATEDMFITEHFFIELSRYGAAIVPIKEIIWIYKHSTLHKVLWYHFVISYTLHIVGRKHFYLQCPRNIKSDIDGIIDYLAEANHDILVGFNEENRLKVQELEHRTSHLEGLFSFLKKRIR